MFDQNVTDYQQLCQGVLQKAAHLGAQSCDVVLVNDEGFDVSVRMGDVDSLTYHGEQGLTITVYMDQKTGVASTTDLSESSIEQSIKKAISIAEFTQEDPCSGLPAQEDLATEIIDCDLYHPWSITPNEAIELARQCEQAGLDFDQRIQNSEGASLNTNTSHKFYANSLGFSGQYQTTSHSMNCVLIAKSGDKMQRDYDYTYSRCADDLLDAKVLGARTGECAVRRLDARIVKTQQASVVFRHDLAAGLLYSFIRAISGASIYRKSSFLLDHLDQKIFPEWMQLTQKPHIPRGLASKPFDSEGVATRDLGLVENGVLKSYITSTYSARKLNLLTTGNAGGVQNVIVHHHDTDFDQMLEEMGTGLFVTELIGQGINMVTGDYSRGAFGYWVEKGKIQYPVEGITIAGNLKDMFANVRMIANDVDLRTTIQTGSILLDSMTIAGS